MLATARLPVHPITNTCPTDPVTVPEMTTLNIWLVYPLTNVHGAPPIDTENCVGLAVGLVVGVTVGLTVGLGVWVGVAVGIGVTPGEDGLLFTPIP